MEIKKNDVFEVNIVDNGFSGEGIAKIDGFTIFVPGAIKGEKCRIKILKVLSSHGFGKIEEILEKSEYRRESDCDTYSRCGGCSMRHIEYERTLEIKRDSVESAMMKQGLDVRVLDTVGMDDPFYYRNKLLYPIGLDSEKKPVMGVYAERSHRIVETRQCMIQDRKLQEIAEFIFDFIVKENVPVYDEDLLKGQVRHLVLRRGFKSNEIMVTVVSNERKIDKEDLLVEALVEKFNEIKTIVKNINPKNTNVVMGRENVVLYGDGVIYDDILGFKFKISPMSFYQVNPVQTEKLYSLAIDGAELKGDETVFDLYCGIGTIGICASKEIGKLYGIETVPEAIQDAKINANLNGVDNSEFFVGDVEKELPEFIKKNKIESDVIFVDPPRKGCDRVALETIMEIGPEKIVYVSCNPATLARDLKILSEKYSFDMVRPVDMFPFTSHVETVVLMFKKI